MKKQILILTTFFSLCTLVLSAKDYKVNSPDGHIIIVISVDTSIEWAVKYNGTDLIMPSPIALDLGNGLILGSNPEVKDVNTFKKDETIYPVVPAKTSSIKDHYNEIRFNFDSDYSVSFRAYNNGIAYRFETDINDTIRIYHETADFNFPVNYEVIFPEEFSFMSHYEQEYKFLTLDSLNETRFCYLPVLLTTPDNVRIAVTEADLYDYPGMFLFGTGKYSFSARFPKVVLETEPTNRPTNEIISKEADYIAETAGTRTFPWRVIMIAENDAQLIENQLVFQLSRPMAIENTDWIRPGKVAWDWWHAWNLYNVDFRAGINTESYKYYIDFAAEYNLEYILIDAGWSERGNLLDVVPDLDLPEVIRYAKEKDVGVFLWVLWKPLDADMENVLSSYSKWGIKGVKVDFMQRVDQYMVNYYERVAKIAAQNKLAVDFHGAFKPAGLRRAYPNVLNYEGVRGLEHCKWSDAITPDHDLIIPFTRMLAGPMDFTPGAMINAQKRNFHADNSVPMSQGTRCHQVAMYVIYEAPLQMLSDSPSRYLQDPECTDFISKIPVTWHDIKILEARVGDYLILARKHDDNWFIGGMTDWTPREFMIDLSFLDDGQYEMIILEDGINAERYGSDYRKTEVNVDQNTTIKIKMVQGGGWAAILKPVNI